MCQLSIEHNVSADVKLPQVPIFTNPPHRMGEPHGTMISALLP